MRDDARAGWAAGFAREPLESDCPLPVYGLPEWYVAEWRVQNAPAVRAAEAWRRQAVRLPQTSAKHIGRGGQWVISL